MVQLPGGVKAVLTEADLFDYPGMDLTAGGAPNTLKGLFPAYPKKVELGRDRDEKVVEREDYIAKTRGTREFPWRVLVVADRDADLLDTDIVYRLASETAMTDTSWIKPGKVAWDWWNSLNLYGVPFQVGREHRHLQARHRLRRRERPRVHHPRRGLVQARRPAVDHAGRGHGGHRGAREAEERRADHVGDLEDARPADGRRRSTSSRSGA